MNNVSRETLDIIIIVYSIKLKIKKKQDWSNINSLSKFKEMNNVSRETYIQ